MPPSSPLARKINAVFIHVSDLKKSSEWWYSTLIGVPFNTDEVEPPVYNIPINSHTGPTLDDHSRDPAFILTPSTHVLFNFHADDIDEAYRFVKSTDAEITREIERIGDFAYFNFCDPDGNVLMVCNN